jgi:hypothetical protein
MKGAPARTIQKLAGHESLSMTERYMHLSPSTMDSAIRLLEQRPICGDISETAISQGKSPANLSGIKW